MPQAVNGYGDFPGHCSGVKIFILCSLRIWKTCLDIALVALVATVRSPVRLHSAESLAKRATQQWQATFDALSEGVAIVDANCFIHRCKRAMTSLLGRAYGEVEGASLSVLLRQCFGPQTKIPEGTRMIELKTGSRFYVQVDWILNTGRPAGMNPLFNRQYCPND